MSSATERYAPTISAVAGIFRPDARCEPQVTGLAADVEQILRQHAAPASRPEPVRHEVPEEPGVYRGYRADVDLEVMVQLDETGQWWPYPYSFSGWRPGEISLFELTAHPEIAMDVPEIRNPELRAAVEELTGKFLAEFPEIDAERARSFVLEHLRADY